MKILITGGGTAGHIYPGIAAAKILLKENEDCEVLYVGSEKGLESNIIPQEGLPFESITVSGLTRRVSPRVLKDLFKTGLGCVQAFSLLRRFKPDVVLGTGGYVCGPVVFTASLLGIPTVLHEQNAFPGITNRMLAPLVDTVAITYEDSLHYFPQKAKCVLTGNPVREEILTTGKMEGKANLGISPNSRVVLVFGGSRGAKKINRAVLDGISFLDELQDVHLIFIPGQQEYFKVQQELSGKPFWKDISARVTVVPYLHNMYYALAAADLVVCRAGATTLAEITARGIPSILIPYPYATGDHQHKNALSLKNSGAAELVSDAELSGSILRSLIISLLSDSQKINRMSQAARALGKPEAGEQLAKLLFEAAKRKDK